MTIGCIIVCPAVAQTPDPAGTTSNNTSKPLAKPTAANPQEKKSSDSNKTKKVWTNDNVGSLKGGVSVIGDKNQSSENAKDYENEADSDEADQKQARVNQYRDALEQLRAQIDDADRRIDKLRNFKGENTRPDGGINPNQKYNMVPPEEQVKQLEARKKQLQAKIEDLENQARKEGIDAGDLR
jgi:chromosome segregation ATPase